MLALLDQAQHDGLKLNCFMLNAALQVDVLGLSPLVFSLKPLGFSL